MIIKVTIFRIGGITYYFVALEELIMSFLGDEVGFGCEVTEPCS
jgi:hypothetical protein